MVSIANKTPINIQEAVESLYHQGTKVGFIDPKMNLIAFNIFFSVECRKATIRGLIPSHNKSVTPIQICALANHVKLFLYPKIQNGSKSHMDKLVSLCPRSHSLFKVNYVIDQEIDTSPKLTQRTGICKNRLPPPTGVAPKSDFDRP